jgi:hypothetical protein
LNEIDYYRFSVAVGLSSNALEIGEKRKEGDVDDFLADEEEKNSRDSLVLIL